MCARWRLSRSVSCKSLCTQLLYISQTGKAGSHSRTGTGKMQANAKLKSRPKRRDIKLDKRKVHNTKHGDMEAADTKREAVCVSALRKDKTWVGGYGWGDTHTSVSHHPGHMVHTSHVGLGQPTTSGTAVITNHGQGAHSRRETIPTAGAGRSWS